MTQLLSHRISFIALSLFAFIVLFSVQIQAQICMTPPDDFTWTCEDEDNEFIYQNHDGVIFTECSNSTIVYDFTPVIDVAIEELGCAPGLYPDVLRRISRTFVYETGNPLDNLCPSYGIGFICSTQVIEVSDDTDPTFLFVPNDVEIECNDWDLEEYLKGGSFGLEFEDNCGTPVLDQDFETIEDSECSAEKSFIWTYTITDLCGRSAQETHIVNVVDTTDPEIIFLPIVPEVYSCVDDVVWPEITAVDMCSSASVNWDGEPTITEQDCPNNFSLTWSATAIDGCGNDVTEDYTIEVSDTQPPQFIDLLPDFTIQCDNASAINLALSAVPTFGDGCNDDVSLITTSQTILGDCPQNSMEEKTFIVEDACGNESDPHTITITIEDTQAPTITLPIEEFQLECTDPLTLEAPIVEDNCGTPTWTEITNDKGDLSDGDLISTTTYIATDECGNTSEAATVVVNIVDTEPPYFTSFPPDMIVVCGDAYDFGVAEYEDSCDPSPFSSDYELIADFQPCANNTLLTQIFTISDDNGNEVIQAQEIRFLDEEPPILLTPLDSLFYQCFYDVPDCLDIFEGLEFDDCSTGEVVPIDCDDVVVEGNCEEQACILERTYYFEDACGNVGSTKQYITVQESVLAPEMPTGITPNGDGLNDAFVIKGIGPSVNPEPGEIQCDWLEDTNMRVINRWGSLVFEHDDYRNDWEGTNKSGEDLPQGTYFVVFEALGQSFSTYLDLRR